LRLHAEVTGAPEESAVRTVCASWTHGELVSASHCIVCGTITKQYFAPGRHTLASAPNNFLLYAYLITVQTQHSHHYFTDVMICAFYIVALCPYTLGTGWSLACDNVLTSLLS